jgi:hypothetical protein
MGKTYSMRNRNELIKYFDWTDSKRLIVRSRHRWEDNIKMDFRCTVSEDVNFILLEDDCVLGCCAVSSGRSLPTFQRSLLPPTTPR